MAKNKPSIKTEWVKDDQVSGESGESGFPDAASHTPRVTSNDWVYEYMHQEPSLRADVPVRSIFDGEAGVGLDPFPLPLDTENFIADEIFDFLKKIDRQGKGIHALDALAKKTRSQTRKSPSGSKFLGRKGPNLDTKSRTPCVQINDAPEARLVSPQEDHLADFLRNIEERYKVLLKGEEEQPSRWRKSACCRRGIQFGAKATDLPPDASAADSCEEQETPSIAASPSTPLSTSSRSQGEGAAPPSPLTLPGGAGKTSGQREADGEEKVYREPTESDVLLGRGGLTNHHAGNKRYRHEIDQLKPWYHSCRTKSEKKELSALFLEYIHGYGGRFLEREEDTGRWYLAPYRRARKKASQALRENKKQKREEQKRQQG